MNARILSSRYRLGAFAGVIASGKGVARAQTPSVLPSANASPIVSDGGFSGIAEDMLATIYQLYALDDDSGLYRPNYPPQSDDRPYAYLWPYSALISALGARARYRQDEEATAAFIESLNALEMYFDAESDPPGYDSYPPSDGGGDKYYDDNQWLGLDFIHAYRLTGDDHWLEKSMLMWDFSMSGWTDEDMDGGIYWRENDIATKNTCSNGPAAVHAMLLHDVTGDQQYLDWAVRIMDWLEQLLDPHLGVYSDHIAIDGRIDRTKWTYNTGTPMEAAALLYRATDDDIWLEKARSLAEASISHFAATHDENGVRNFPPTPWFNAVLQRAYCTLYDVDPERNRVYIDALPALLLRAWARNRNEAGLLHPDWSRTPLTDDSLDLLEQAAVVEIASLAALYEP